MKRQYVLNERIEQNSRKKTKQNGDKQSTGCREFIGHRMINEVRGRVDELRTSNSMKRGRETITKETEMKDTVTKMMNNLQGTNSGVDEAKNQISSLE